jgi:PhnB protein
MSNISIPDGYQFVMPYLIVKNADGLLGFMKTVFGAVEKYIAKSEDNTIIMHGEVIINGSTIMFAESSELWQPQPAGLFVYVSDVDATYKKALAAGASSVMEISDKGYGRSGGLKDSYGNTWWITTPDKQS